MKVLMTLYSLPIAGIDKQQPLPNGAGLKEPDFNRQLPSVPDQQECLSLMVITLLLPDQKDY
jgi:hypothetical protein